MSHKLQNYCEISAKLLSWIEFCEKESRDKRQETRDKREERRAKYQDKEILPLAGMLIN